MDYRGYFTDATARIKDEKRYRIFRSITRSGDFPVVNFFNHAHHEKITAWCGVDYLGLSQDPQLKACAIQAIEDYGIGSGGTRNIGGNIQHHVLLEAALARLHQQEAGLLFTSGYMANEATLKTLGKLIPGLVFFSDQQNHMSIIEGLRESGCEKVIYQHNDVADLEQKLAQYDRARPKIIVFESVYSMNGSIAPMKEIIALAKKYQTMTYVDEVHALAVYGSHGGGISELTHTARDLDIIQGTLSKGFGLMGGYITASHAIIDAIRSSAHGFIFTTSLPPHVSITALQTLSMPAEIQTLQTQLFNIVDYVKQGLMAANLKLMPSPSHIIPLWIGDALLCEQVGLRLLEEFKIYIQPVNYPTVRRGEERFRISPTARHTLKDADALIAALEICLG